jgi:hypothetical protein
MSWLEVLKKNDKEFDTSVDTTQIEEEVIEEDIYRTLIFKDGENEFDRLYLSKITEIKCELQDHLVDNALPFLDKLNNNDYGFYDFIKETSYNYYEVKEKVDKENDEIKKEEDELNEDELYDSFD